jgi:hypothetical protein
VLFDECVYPDGEFNRHGVAVLEKVMTLARAGCRATSTGGSAGSRANTTRSRGPCA